MYVCMQGCMYVCIVCMYVWWVCMVCMVCMVCRVCIICMHGMYVGMFGMFGMYVCMYVRAMWEPIANANLRIMNRPSYLDIRDCKKLHRD